MTTQAGGAGGPAADGTAEGTEGRVYNVAGGDWDEVLQALQEGGTRPTPSTWSSTWGRSTPPRTACCAWC